MAPMTRLIPAEVISLALAVFSVAGAAQTSGAVRSGTAEPVYSVLSPLGESTVKMIEMTPRPKTLAGKTVCMVSNRAFKADIALPAIAEQLKKAWPDIRVVSHTQMPMAPLPSTPDNPQQDAEKLKLAMSQQGCSVVVTGDGGCGVCTPRATQAAVVAEKLGIPSVVVAAPAFRKQAEMTAHDQGVPSLRVAVYPGPFDLHSDSQVRENAAKVVVPQVIEALTKPLAEAAPHQEPALKKAREVVFTDTLDEVNRYFADYQWSDGMAIVPPTVERVEEFLKYTGYAPHEEIAVLPLANLRATPWNIAVNAVMAGARPEHMPVIIAAVQAIGDPAYRLTVTGGSTHSLSTFYWLNGPLARQLGIDYGQGLIAAPPNAAIGRAMSLIERNIAGFRIKETQMGTFGKLQSWVLAEDEEALKNIGWEPDHVGRGFDRNANTVAAASSSFMGQNVIPSTSDPKILVQLLAYGITYNEAFATGMIDSPRTLLITPGTAEVLAKGGYTKQKLIDELVETARKPTYEWTFSKVYGSYGRIFRSFEAEVERDLNDRRAAKGKLPPWYPRTPGWEEIKTIPSIARNGIRILVCGDPSRNKAQVLAGATGKAVKQVKLPANWDELMEKAGYRPLKEFVIQ
jgi:hypothetical protein